ncbi:MAG: MSCRAMM family protein, partial [Candidatus Thorarchaeota archaeon]
ILYIESMTISVTYNYSSAPIPNATVYVTFDGSGQRNLTFNAFTQQWEILLDGVDYLGSQTINVTAMSDGYVTRFEVQTFVVLEDNPVLGSSWIGNISTTDYATLAPLTITLTMSNGTSITDATVSFTVFGTPYSLSIGPGGLYTFNINPTETRGIETFIVSAVRTGYVSDQISLNLTVEATTSLDFRNLFSAEYEEWNLTIEARYLDTFYSTPITNATVTVTLDGTDYVLTYLAGVYTIEIVLDLDPGDYTIYVSAIAEYAAFATNQAAFTVHPKEVVSLEVTFEGDLIAGQFMEILATLRDNNSDPIQGETIRFEVTVYFDNGTVVIYNTGTMTDSTNTVGVASVGFQVPIGNVNSLTARAFYDGSRTRWATDVSEEASVGVSPISLLLAFFTSDIGILMIFSIAILGAVAAGYNRVVKPKKKAVKVGLANQLQMFEDLDTVQHFMAVYLDRGTCVFYHPFTEERIQPDLISGFISAITSVYGEIKGDGVRGTLEEIQYQGLRLNSYSGQYIIGILILGGEMTPLLRERLQFFVELFENQYDHELDGWAGAVDCFDPEWVVSNLNSAFNYSWHLPHKFGPTQKVSKTETKILDYIGAVRDERSEFYIKNLLAPLSEMLDMTPAQVLDQLLLLEDRGVIAPIGIQTILQRQGLGLTDEVDDISAPAESKPKEVLEYELVEEPEEDVAEKPKGDQDADPMEAFVQDVESILEREAEEEKSRDNDK